MDDLENAYRPCPFCAEPIRSAAIKCRHCGSDVRQEAVRAFMGSGAATEGHQPTRAQDVGGSVQSARSVPLSSEPHTLAREIARLTTGLVGHWVVLAAIGYALLVTVFAAMARQSSSSTSPETIKFILSIFFALGTIGYALIGIGWASATRVATRHTLGCAVASFLQSLVGIVSIIGVWNSKIRNRELVDSEWTFLLVVAANGIYMFTLAYWYWSTGLALLHKNGQGFKTFLSHLAGPGLALAAALAVFPGVLASDNKVKFLFIFLSLLCTALPWSSVWMNFYEFRGRLEVLAKDAQVSRSRFM